MVIGVVAGVGAACDGVGDVCTDCVGAGAVAATVACWACCWRRCCRCGACAVAGVGLGVTLRELKFFMA